jgi:hypothetical protein
MKYLINKRNSFYVLALILFNACIKKQLPKNEDGNANPVFYMKALVNNLPVSLEAGKNNLYMFADWSYNSFDSIYSFVGTLQQKNCINNCGYSMRLLINNNVTLAPGQSPNVNSSISSSTYSFQIPHTNTIYDCIFTSNSPFSPYNVWTFNDGSSLNGLYAQKQFLSGTTQTVNLKANNSTCIFNVFNVYKIGSPLQVSVWGNKDTAQASSTFNFNSNYTGTSSVTCLWDFGDGTSSTQQNPTHTYFNFGYYLTKLTVKSITDTAVCYYRAAVVNGQPCNANITASMTQISPLKPFSKVVIEITDDNGKTYSSANIIQLNDSFTITSVEDYETSDSGVRTKKIKFNFNCKVQSGSDILDIKNGEAVFAVGYN